MLLGLCDIAEKMIITFLRQYTHTDCRCNKGSDFSEGW